jgi:hypothetical protein
MPCFARFLKGMTRNTPKEVPKKRQTCADLPYVSRGAFPAPRADARMVHRKLKALSASDVITAVGSPATA